MSLRLQINLLVAGLILAFIVTGLTFEVLGTRASVHEEITSADVVANKLLGHFVDTTAETTQPAVLAFLEPLGRVRSIDITLRDADGRLVYHSPPSPYKAGRYAPRWYAALVAPAAMHNRLQLADGSLDIQANASRSVLDGWDDTVRLLVFGAIAMVVANLLVFWLVHRFTRPLRTIVERLDAMQAGAYRVRLPPVRGREAAAIAGAFNRAMDAIEENLAARHEADEAKLRLAQTRELAELVQGRIDEERRQIARELHDETSSGITAIRSMALTLVARPEGIDERSRDAARLIADTAARLYAAMHDLIPRLQPPALDQLGLADALEERVAAWRRDHPQVDFALVLGALPDALGTSYALAAYRIVQEATTNALRHADPHHVGIRVDSDAQVLRIEVTDDGCGLAPDWQRPGHYGVRGMRERARALGGDVQLVAGPGGGVCVRASLPLGMPA